MAEFSTRYNKVCAVCDEPFVARLPYAKLCSDRCKNWSSRAPGRKPPPRRNAVRGCEQCGKSMAGRHSNARFCDDRCWHRFHNPPADLTVPIVCDVCSSEFYRKSERGTAPKFCTNRCEQWRRRHPDAEWIASGRRCDHCGTDIDHMRNGARFCSPICCSGFAGHKRRVMLRSLPHEPINKYRVFERDGWLCHLCTKRIDKTLKHPDPMSASLDHVIPISDPESPGHVWANVAASHLTCNLRKHTSSMGEQLMLFGAA